MNLNTPGEPTLCPLCTRLCTGELNAIRKQKGFLCRSFLRKGVSLGYVGAKLKPQGPEGTVDFKGDNFPGVEGVKSMHAPQTDLVATEQYKQGSRARREGGKRGRSRDPCYRFSLRTEHAPLWPASRQPTAPRRRPWGG